MADFDAGDIGDRVERPRGAADRNAEFARARLGLGLRRLERGAREQSGRERAPYREGATRACSAHRRYLGQSQPKVPAVSAA